MNRTKFRRDPHLLRQPLPHLLQSNQFVTEEEHALVLQSIARVRTEIARLNELESLEGDSQAYYEHRLVCVEFISKHEKLLHWTRRIPPEILIHIFFCCTDNNTRIPWNVSQVCRKWRYIALSIPVLWRKFKPRYNFTTDTARSEYLQFLRKDYFVRSGKESIIFSLKDAELENPPIFEVLMEFAERWGDVHFSLRANGFYDQGTMREGDESVLKGRLSSLYSLDVKLLGGWDINDRCLEVFREAPRLRRVLIDGSASSFGGNLQLGWPWHQVTHFSGIVTLRNFLDYATLGELQNLVYLSLGGVHMLRSRSMDTGSKLVFNSCRYLHLDIGYLDLPSDVFPSSDFIAKTIFPVLEHFYISYSQTNLWSYSAVIPFVERLASTLKSLHWQYNIPLGPETFQKDGTLRKAFANVTFPELKALRISEPLECWKFTRSSPGGQTICDSLAALNESHDRLPSLQKLDIRLRPDTKGEELPEICQLVSGLVDVDEELEEERATGMGEGRGMLEEVRVGLPGSSSSDMTLAQCDILAELEGWAEGLQEGWETQVRLELELEKMKKWKSALEDVYARLEQLSSSEVEDALLKGIGYDVTDALVLIITEFPPLIQKFIHLHRRSGVLSSKGIEYIEGLLVKWERLYQEMAPSRRWAVSGPNKVVYVAPSSALRKDISTWMFGIPDDPRGFEYLYDGYIPELGYD